MRKFGALIAFCVAIVANDVAMAKCTKMTSLTGGVSTANEYLWTDTGAFYECGDNCDGGTTKTGTFRLEGKVQTGTFICMEEWTGDYWKKINNGDNCVLWTNLWGGNKTSNEYLWMPDGSGFYECGDGCPNGTVKNGRFKLKEEVKTGRFVCHVEWNGDYWTYENTSSSSGGSTPAPNPTSKCPNGKKTGETWTAACSGSSWESVKLYGKDCGARCNSGGNYSIYAITCKNGYKPSDKWDAIAGGGYKACVKNGNGGGGGGGTTPAPSCADRYGCKNNPNRGECYACCSVASSVAKWNTSTNKCDCVDSTKTFDAASGQCVAGTVTPAPTSGFKCPDAKIAQLAVWKVKCAKNTAIMGFIDSIETYCSGTDITEAVFNNFYNQLVNAHPENCGASVSSEEEKFCAQISDAQMVGGVCKCKDTTKELDREQKKCVASQASMNASKTTIETTFKKLDGINSTFGTSVWKNKEGNFNTARLASDATAGVVLGTVGGLVTSNVVKKNQIKGGFEDINCTIGGQVVSGWGDEFNVGINTSGQ